jgi:hypothetical protein
MSREVAGTVHIISTSAEFGLKPGEAMIGVWVPAETLKSVHCGANVTLTLPEGTPDA